VNVVQIETWAPPQTTVVPRPHRAGQLGEWIDGGVTALLVVLVGAPVGLVWAALRPAFDPTLAIFEVSRNTGQFEVDLRFAIVTVVAGLLVGVGAWSMARRNSLGVVVGLLVGGLAAAWIAQRVGVMATHPGDLRHILAAGLDEQGYTLDKLAKGQQAAFLEDSRFGLRAMTLILTLPLVAVATFAALLGLFDRTSRSDVSVEADGHRGQVGRWS
jgi:multisubunit Na+/H+ antiporter MnhC subunit